MTYVHLDDDADPADIERWRRRGARVILHPRRIKEVNENTIEINLEDGESLSFKRNVGKATLELNYVAGKLLRLTISHPKE